MKFDVTALWEEPGTLAKVPVFFLLFLVVRGLPALLTHRRVLELRERVSLMLLQSTALPLLVVITEIGLATDQMRVSTATALVAAGMLSVLVYPLAGFAVIGGSRSPSERSGDLGGEPQHG
jgi:hypothetical protein